MTTGMTVDSAHLSSFYGDLLADGFFVFNDGDPYFQERIVQIAWNEQILQKPLQTVCGATVEVIHPGTWNVEAGPDFRDAVLFINGASRRGPVEIHIRPEDWFHHGHDSDPAYAETILHVVWSLSGDTPPEPGNLPTLVVRDHLTVPLNDLLEQHSVAGYPYAKQVPPGDWSAHMAGLSDDQLGELCQSYGVARMLGKARQLGERIQQCGLDAAVYERICDAMGYKSNRAAFAKLAELLPLDMLKEETNPHRMALLFGAAGLLPDPSRTAVLPEYQDLVKSMWDRWWGHRQAYSEITWNRRSRPFNAPERRLLALALILERTQCRPGSHMVRIICDAPDAATALKRLTGLFTADDDQWRSFYRFGKKLEQPGALLGASRINDLLANVAVPCFFAWCLLHNRPEECRKGRDLLQELPRLQDSRLLKEAVGVFFVPPSRARRVITNACAQQGLIKLYRELARPELTGSTDA